MHKLVYNYAYTNLKTKILQKMPHTPNHAPQIRNYNYNNGVAATRSIGHSALAVEGLRQPEQRQKLETRTSSPLERLQMNTRAAVTNHLNRVRDVLERRDGTKPKMDANLVRQAYISQRRRLMDKKITEEMTTTQLTAELMAKAVFFGPTVSDALKNRHSQRSKNEFAEWNDILAEIARSLPSGKLQPGFKSGLADVLKNEIRVLSDEINHSAEICGKDPKTKRDNIFQDFLGVQGEISAINDLQTDKQLDVRVPDADEFGVDEVELDREGIDAVIQRTGDGKEIFVDMKSHGSYLRHIAEMQGKSFIPEESVGRSYFTGIHKRGAPHYLLNIDSYGEIPADGFHFNEQGRAQLLRDIHNLLDE